MADGHTSNAGHGGHALTKDCRISPVWWRLVSTVDHHEPLYPRWPEYKCVFNVGDPCRPVPLRTPTSVAWSRALTRVG